MHASEAHILKAALEWYDDQGVDAILGEEAIDRYKETADALAACMPSNMPQKQDSAAAQPPSFAQQAMQAPAPAALGASEAREQAVRLAQEASTIEELKAAMAEFDGIALKKTATNMVFSDGNADAKVMLIGEAPGADEDRMGQPFAGEAGHLLDRIFACIDLGRKSEEAAQSVYISNILNWRPPGNRNPTPGEVEASLPFIERHIQLAQPQLLIFCGGIAAKSLLGRSEGLSRLRKKWHEYSPQTPELAQDAKSIPAIATYHPAYLLRTPSQKRAVWMDMLMVQEKLKTL